MNSPASAPASSLLAIANGIAPVSVIMLLLALLFVAGRLFSNLSTSRTLKLDDYACIAAAILFFVYTGLVLTVDYETHHNPAQGDWLESLDIKAVYAAETIAGPAVFFAKASVLLLYLRIFSPLVIFRYFIYAGLVFAFCFQCLEIPVYTYYCASHDGVWDQSVALRCESTAVFGIVQTACDAALNVYILVLPIPSIMALHLSLKNRLGVVFILMHGVFALVASLVGLSYRVGVFNDPGSLYPRTAAFTCIIVEIAMTIVSSSFHACISYMRTVKEKSRLSGGSSSERFNNRSRTTAMSSVPSIRPMESISHMPRDLIVKSPDTHSYGIRKNTDVQIVVEEIGHPGHLGQDEEEVEIRELWHSQC